MLTHTIQKQMQAGILGGGSGIIDSTACFVDSIIGTGKECHRPAEVVDTDSDAHDAPDAPDAPSSSASANAYNYTYNTNGDGTVTYVVTPQGKKACTYTVKAPDNLKDRDVVSDLASRCK